jgi:multidrug efflux system membrane fusion protein
MLDMSFVKQNLMRSKWLAVMVMVLGVTTAWWYPEIKQWMSPSTTTAQQGPDKASDKNADKTKGMGRPGNKEGGGGKHTPVSAVEVKQMDIRQSVDALGTLTALNTAVVRAKVDGELKAVSFTEGQWVQAGQVLAEIDARAYEAQLNQAQGQLARDTAQLKNAQLDLQRYQDLLSKDAIARQQVETQAALVGQLQGTVQANQAQVEAARLQLSYTKVTAPISGRLGLKQSELGSLVRASDPNGLVSITQTQPMAVVFAVPEVHVPLIMRKLKAGQALPVQAWDRDRQQRLAQGRVSTTDNAIDIATGTLKLKATLDNKQGLLFPNQFAQIRLELDTLKNVLVVPTQAIQRGAQGTFVCVVQADNSIRLQNVKLLAVEGEWQAVQGELKVGERVVTDGADRLRNGSTVEVVMPAKP